MAWIKAPREKRSVKFCFFLVFFALLNVVLKKSGKWRILKRKPLNKTTWTLSTASHHTHTHFTMGFNHFSEFDISVGVGCTLDVAYSRLGFYSILVWTLAPVCLYLCMRRFLSTHKIFSLLHRLHRHTHTEKDCVYLCYVIGTYVSGFIYSVYCHRHTITRISYGKM